MAIELKQNLKLSQQLVITPQLQQAIKLLQLSRMELVEMVQDEMLENPVLEESTTDEEIPPEVAKELETEGLPTKTSDVEEEVRPSEEAGFKEPTEFDWENYTNSYSSPGYEAKNFDPDDLPSYENFVSKSATLSDHLEWQLQMTDLSSPEKEAGMAIIGAIDDEGYLTTPLEEIAQKESLKIEMLQKALLAIRDFDPAGVGARDLKECLLLQARFFGEERTLLEMIISEHLHLLERKDYPTLARKLKLPLTKVVHAARIISEMEPKPGRPFGKQDTQYITPDVYVYKVGNEFAVVLNEEGLPRLQVSRFYRNMLTEKEKKDKAHDYIQDKFRNAIWLIKSIHQRQRTLYRVTKSIVEHQIGFFEKGVIALKPLVLRDIADDIGVHESTVSRATTNKFVHTPHGIFELKYFFNSGLSNSTGQDVASESVKDKIRQFVSAEDNKKPLSDIQLVELLKKCNIDVARRTVAKYRDMLKILPSSKRKKLY